MKIVIKLSIIGIFLLMVACVSTTKFPISNAVPAAEITAKKKQDKNNNYVIELTAKNLAEASRLNPSMNNYSVWIVADDGSTKNIGQLTNENAKTAVLKTVTPFNVNEIFITAEERGSLSYPAGIEISRTTFNNK